ncbi:cobalt transporter CbiM [Candidatus Chlorohelix sp.]|uniref:cobalt transporter CbiM n=1 Tax=Candidatus Chlorohelix sp. TaxID=3139201 RepID=UPI0030731242
MHIPDGYLSPVVSLGAAVVTVPVWGIAVQKVRNVLNQRTVPLLAIFSAFAFTIMMFNIPVPGGTTAHAVGGTLIAVVLGPWAAALGISMALILQALFFGDGGILAIFINCLNMGVLLPFAGYFSYRLLAGRSPVLSVRRVWAAGIGAYIGITLSGLAVGIELGIQPLLFTENGRPLYSPYGLEAAIPTMLIAHIFAASIVEGLVTALGVAYLQKNYPVYLTSLRKIIAGADISDGTTGKQPFLPVAVIGGVVGLAIIVFAGLIAGNWDFGKLFGTDWSQVNWADVAVMLLIVGIICAVLVPLAWFVLPRSMKKVGAYFTALAVLAPIGLIAPGFAYGEGSVEDVDKAFGYVPQGLKDFSDFFKAPLADYKLPFPPFDGENSQLWQQAIGYEIAGIVGILLLGGLMFGLAMLLKKRGTVEETIGVINKPGEAPNR